MFCKLIAIRLLFVRIKDTLLLVGLFILMLIINSIAAGDSLARNKINFNNINNFGYAGKYLLMTKFIDNYDCNLVAFRYHYSYLDDNLKQLLLDDSAENKFFHLSTLIFGTDFLAKNVLLSDSDVVFTLVLEGDPKFPKYAILIPKREIEKINDRDFGERDNQLTMKDYPYTIPPYPLKKVFENSKIADLSIDNSGKKILVVNKLATSRYKKFLKSFLFSQYVTGTYDEMRISTIYRKYENMDREVYGCIEKKDYLCLESYIKLGLDLNRWPRNNEPYIITAIRENDVRLLDLLLRNNANPNIISNIRGTTITPLMFAATKGYLVIIKKLLAYGADPNIKNNDGVIALDLARLENHPASIAFLKPLTKVDGVWEKSQRRGSEKISVVSVSIEAICGIVPCTVSDFKVYGGNGGYKRISSTSCNIVNVGSGVAGVYQWSAIIDNKVVTGTLRLSGKKRLYYLHVYRDGDDAGSYEM